MRYLLGALQNFREQVLTWLQRRLAISPSQAVSLPRVYVHSQHVDDVTYPRLYKSCDCVVLPTRYVHTCAVLHVLYVQCKLVLYSCRSC